MSISNEGLGAPVGPLQTSLDRPRIVDSTIAVDSANFTAGYDKLTAAGLDPERIAKLVISGGGACVGGTFAELMVLEAHTDMAADIVTIAQEAIVDSKDPTEAVFSAMKMVLMKDTNTKKLIEANVDIESLKKNNPTAP